eukprot:m.179098 g.179098  ORF g.179098 m.179098 type:complete len:201 (+) comp31956_c0_seq3:516-1118(+)
MMSSWNTTSGFTQSFFGRVIPLLVGNSAVLVSARTVSLTVLNRTINHEVASSHRLTKAGVGDVLYTEPDAGTYSSTAPVIYSPTLYLVGGLFAVMALFLALATQKEKKITSPARSPPTDVRKVRWRLGDSISEDDQPKPNNNNTNTNNNNTNTNNGNYTNSYNYNRTRQHVPSYDGCYYGADPQDDHKTPSPQTSRRYFN